MSGCPARSAAGLTVVALLSASVMGAGRVSMRASPSIAFAPANLMIQTQVEAADVNRALEVIADSGVFYRSSEIPLDGEHAPRTVMVEFRNLPAGSYAVRAVLKGPDGRELATIGTRITVVESATAGR